MILPERFWAKVVENEDGCLIWTGALNNQGYGVFALAGRTQLAHRLAYWSEVGPIPEGLQVDHLCRTRDCVNVRHLEAVTASENNRRKPGHVYVTHRYRTPIEGWVEASHSLSSRLARSCPYCKAARAAA